MKFLKILFAVLILSSCNNQAGQEINLSEYFRGINGTAVFYNPTLNQYKIYNSDLSTKRSSPCSTFKIMSAYIALSEKIVTPQNSVINWNQKNYEFSDWNKDMNIREAIRVSCVWYFRALIDKIPPRTIAAYLQKYQYGNQDISDWEGNLNTNAKSSELKGFWIESSLKISPVEQVNFLAKLFGNGEKNTAVKNLKDFLSVSDTPVKIYGKTGLGIKDDLVQEAWFVGFYEKNNQDIYFAVRLDDKQNPIEDYRHKASQYAKQIALDIIGKEDIF